MELDSFDIAILRALQRDASLTNAGLSAQVNLSASQCSRRRSALESAGVILGYGARLNAPALGFGLRAIVRVNLSAHSGPTDGAFATFLRDHDAVAAAWSVSGDADYVLDIHVADLAAFAGFIHEDLLPHEEVAQVRSEIVLKTAKEGGRLPL
jgi:DNA-binding Lrp family transcriptional regulator